MTYIGSARPKNLEVGTIIPGSGDGDGKFGRYIQESYDESGIFTNYGKGSDLPGFDVEIKSSMVNSNTYVSVGSATLEDIVSSDGAVFMDKFIKWHYYTIEKLNDDHAVIKNFETIDWYNINEYLLEDLKALVENYNNRKSNIKESEWTLAESKCFVLERPSLDIITSGKLRIKPGVFNGIKKMTSSQVGNLFE